VRAILADPCDNLARAAYADWLEENGAPLHAELQRLPASEEERRRRLVKDIGRPAFQAFDSSMAGYAGLGEDDLLEVHMQMQGFVAKYFQARAAACLRAHHIDRIALQGKLKDWSRLATALHSSGLRAVSLSHTDIRDDGLKALARCEGMGRLCALSIRWAHVNHNSVMVLCGSKTMGRLVSLALPATGINPDSMASLADGPLAGRLRRLDLGDARLGDRELAVLLGSRALASALVSLDLSRCELTDRSIGALAACPHLGALRSLDLSLNRFSEAGLAMLTASGGFRRLHWLRMAWGPHHDNPDELRGLARAAADVPGLTLVLSRPRAGAPELAEMLGPRLVLEG
jgi:uncharacterized protein (TIGR02996 family)